MQNILKPIKKNFYTESSEVLKMAITANRHLAELKGISSSIPNQNLLIHTLSLQEAKQSSEIENIITTHDELFKQELYQGKEKSISAKEVRNYVKALSIGNSSLAATGLISKKQILEIQAEIEGNNAGFRTLPGTELRNDRTGEVIYTPPQDYDTILALMDNLELIINDETFLPYDPLIKMAIIHHQFESIHPFYDANGRTGRIINILYLVKEGLLDIPVLYLSRYINQTKSEYYKQLQAVRESNNWDDWILYILKGIAVTSLNTIEIIKEIKQALYDYKHKIRKDYTFYSQDLINNLFFHPYTKIDFVIRDLKVSRKTATSYLEQLVEGGFLEKRKFGRNNYYINIALFKILAE